MAREGNFKILKIVSTGEGKDKKVTFEPFKASRELENTNDAVAYAKEQKGALAGRIAVVDLKGIFDITVKSEPQVMVNRVDVPEKPEPKAKAKKSATPPAAPETPPAEESPAEEPEV